VKRNRRRRRPVGLPADEQKRVLDSVELAFRFGAGFLDV
jgi:hypothetical protein